MHSLIAVWLIAILSLANVSAAGQQPSACLAAQAFCTAAQSDIGGSPIAFEDYWDLVSDTRQAIARMEGKPEGTIRRELEALASQWEQVTAVEYPDRSVTQIDSAYLVAELRQDPPRLERLGNEFEALLRAHAEYPQNVFTLEDVAPLKEILARPEFQWQPARTLQLPEWLKKLREQFNKLMDRVILEVAEFIYQQRDLLKIAAVLVFLLSLFFIARSLSHSLVQEAEMASEGDEGDESLTSNGAFKRAETLSMQGDYRNAIRYLYLSSLLVLDEQGLMRYDRSRTNREYLRSIASKPELAKPLRSVIDVFDRVWYGFENVDEQTYQSYVERVDELREKKE